MANILLVDDLESVLEKVGRAIQQAGHDLTTAENGREALNKVLYDNSFDLIITDIHMPEMNGIEFMTQLRQKGIESPIVVCSSDYSESTRLRAFELGAKKYFDKHDLYTVDQVNRLTQEILQAE